MKLTKARDKIDAMRRLDVGVFSIKDLSLLFHEKGITLKKTVAQLVQQGNLTRATRGVYVHATQPIIDHVRQRIVLSLRGSEDFTYVSLECALHRHQLITQVPTALTLMTTGRSARLDTPFGLIELRHTQRAVPDLYRRTQMADGPLPWADPTLAIQDANRSGRAQDLLEDYRQQYG